MNSNDEKRDTSSTSILLHDLPTQIIRPTEGLFCFSISINITDRIIFTIILIDEELALIADRIENIENVKQYETRKSLSGDILAVTGNIAR